MPGKKLLELFTIEFSLTYQALVLEAVVDRSDKEPEGPVMQDVRTFELWLYFKCRFVKKLNEYLDDLMSNNWPEVLKSEFQQVVGSQDKSPEKEQFHVDQGAGIIQNIFRVLEYRKIYPGAWISKNIFRVLK